MRLSLVLYTALLGLAAANAGADVKVDKGVDTYKNDRNNYGHYNHDDKYERKKKYGDRHKKEDDHHKKEDDHHAKKKDNHHGYERKKDNHHGYERKKDNHHGYEKKKDNHHDYDHKKEDKKYKPKYEVKKVEHHKKVRYYCEHAHHGYKLYCCNGRKTWGKDKKYNQWESAGCVEYNGCEEDCHKSYNIYCCKEYKDSKYCKKCEDPKKYW